MERLTENYLGCNQINDCGNAKCEETCKEVENCDSCPISKAIDKLAEYEQAEEDGLLIRLPCKVGDALYHIGKNNLYDCRFIGLVYDICNKEWICEIAIELGLKWAKTTCSMDCIGKTVFLTKAEAEQALAKMKGE
jgi:hypothetical protein